MKKLAIITVVLFLAAMAVEPALAGRSDRAADCSTYARNRADMEKPAGGGVLRGGLRGAAGGALFGAIVGGRKGAKRGAAVGGGLGAIGGGVRSSKDRQARYRHYYENCMRGDVRDY